MKTALCERLGIALPIIQAPMGGAVSSSLAAAVSNAGGLGMLVLWRADIDTVRRWTQARATVEAHAARDHHEHPLAIGVCEQIAAWLA